MSPEGVGGVFGIVKAGLSSWCQTLVGLKFGIVDVAGFERRWTRQSANLCPSQRVDGSLEGSSGLSWTEVLHSNANMSAYQSNLSRVLRCFAALLRLLRLYTPSLRYEAFERVSKAAAAQLSRSNMRLSHSTGPCWRVSFVLECFRKPLTGLTRSLGNFACGLSNLCLDASFGPRWSPCLFRVLSYYVSMSFPLWSNWREFDVYGWAALICLVLATQVSR